MRKFLRLCAATTLLFVLSLSALAGTIHTNVVEPPPPPASATATELSADTTHGTQDPVQSETLIAEITLSLLRLLTVF